MSDQTAKLAWHPGGVPVSVRYDDPYFSLEDGLAETRHVFLAGNGLPERFRPGFHIAELGFGTGLNLMAALAAWRGTGTEGRLRFTSFEAYPLTPAEMARALGAFPEIRALADPLLHVLETGTTQVTTEDLEFDLIVGDASAALPAWTGQADAWFLDGFAPAKNPDLWTPALMAGVARHTAPGGTAATYTAAGGVRRALGAAGFAVDRRPGFGRKRHMTVARLS